jgi:hypothetical protein
VSHHFTKILSGTTGVCAHNTKNMCLHAPTSTRVCAPSRRQIGARAAAVTNVQRVLLPGEAGTRCVLAVLTALFHRLPATQSVRLYVSHCMKIVDEAQQPVTRAHTRHRLPIWPQCSWRNATAGQRVDFGGDLRWVCAGHALL